MCGAGEVGGSGGCLDVLGLEAEAYEAAEGSAGCGDVGERAEEKWRVLWFGVGEDAVDEAVGEDLDALGVADGGFAVVLEGEEVVEGQRAGAKGIGEAVGGGDGVLDGDVDADAADGGHGVGGVADAEEAGDGPALEVVDLDGEEFDFVPGIELGGAVAEERD